jgi:hypothetical protein
MHDRDIRAALHASELASHKDQPDTLVIDELGICRGKYRVDIAVVNGAMHGYEIKSDRDTLTRLESQAAAYSSVFDSMTLVVGASHTPKIWRMVPPWWGITEASAVRGRLHLQVVRQGSSNPSPDPITVAQLLWREEALMLLEARGIARGFRSARVAVIWKALADVMPFTELAAAVRHTLKTRQGWRC